MTALDLNAIYKLIPAVYRIRDAELALASGNTLDPADAQALDSLLQLLAGSPQSLSWLQSQQLAALQDKQQRGPLKSLIAILAEQIEVLQESLYQAYDDQFIETCQEWVVPYIGDLVGATTLADFPGTPYSLRAAVADTIANRRRKGTVSGLESLSRDVTGWPARVVEYFQLLATTQFMNHTRPANLSWSDVRGFDWGLPNTPFDTSAHTADVRGIASAGGKYNIPNIGIWLWRLEPFHMENAPAFQLDSQRYLFDTLGRDTQLFTLPQPVNEETGRATPLNVPMPITRRMFYSNPRNYYGQNLSFFIDSSGAGSLSVSACNLSDIKDNTGKVIGWAHQPKDSIAIDPELGRIAFPATSTPGDVRVSYTYAFSADIGGGPYSRPFDDTAAMVIRVPEESTTIIAALTSAGVEFAGGKTSIVILIDNNDYFVETPSVNIPANCSLEIRAADGFRPTLVLSADLDVFGGPESSFAMNGLLVSGGCITVPGSVVTGLNALSTLTISHCTLAPIAAAAIGGAPAQAMGPRITVDAEDVSIELDHSITGALRIASSCNTTIESAIVDAGSQYEVAYADETCSGSGGQLTVTNSTLIGQVHAPDRPRLQHYLSGAGRCDRCLDRARYRRSVAARLRALQLCSARIPRPAPVPMLSGAQRNSAARARLHVSAVRRRGLLSAGGRFRAWHNRRGRRSVRDGRVPRSPSAPACSQSSDKPQRLPSLRTRSRHLLRDLKEKNHMAGDFSRNSVNRAAGYTGVLMQQGRVQLDADWNEQLALAEHRTQTETRDVIGCCGTPRGENGFKIEITPDGTDFFIDPGRFYAGGLLCENCSEWVELQFSDEILSSGKFGTKILIKSPKSPVLPSSWLDGRPLRAGDWVEVKATGATGMLRTRIVSIGDDDSVVFNPSISGYDKAGAVFVRRAITYLTQPFYPSPDTNPAEADSPLSSPASGGLDLPDGEYLVYLEAWQREVNALEDPHLREVALGGPDTAERLQTVWQVKLLKISEQVKLPEEGERRPCQEKLTEWTQLVAAARTTGQMNARSVPPPPDSNPCILPPSAGFTGLENQLYRIEIFTSSDTLAGATVVWSRDNAMVETGIVSVDSANTNVITVQDLGKDDLHSFTVNDWVEIVDRDSELNRSPRFLAQIVAPAPDPATKKITLSLPVPNPGAMNNPGTDAFRLRRWDMSGASVTPEGIPLKSGWLQLESGVEVSFTEGSYVSRSFWLVPARTATADIEWPPFQVPNTQPLPQPPLGEFHNFCRLALIESVYGKWTAGDCRLQFPSLTNICADDVCYHSHCDGLKDAETVEQALDRLCEESKLRFHKKYLHGWGSCVISR